MLTLEKGKLSFLRNGRGYLPSPTDVCRGSFESVLLKRGIHHLKSTNLHNVILRGVGVYRVWFCTSVQTL